MRDYVLDPHSEEQHSILESFVAVEIENADGDVMCVYRNVVSTHDRKLISVVEGPELTGGGGDFTRRDYFVLDAGAAQREAGFHRKLAEFMGWKLPVVKRYDGSECPLYVETLFPLFFVEQKVGWTAIPGAIPTQFRIREVHRRAVEFILNLDTHELELRRQDIELRLAAARTEWSKMIDGITGSAMASGLRVARLATTPTAFENEVRTAFLEVYDDEKWIPLRTLFHDLAAAQAQLEQEDIPQVEKVVEGATLEVENLSRQIQKLNADRTEVFKLRQNELVQQASTEHRINLLDEDLQKNKDALKLQKFGSTLSRELHPHHCPTCEQPIDDALLPQGTIDSVMSIEDNISYIEAQRRAFKRLAERSTIVIRDLDLELLTTAEDARHLSSRLRTLKSDLVAPSHAASASVIEARLRIEQRLSLLSDAEARFSNSITQLAEQAQNWSDLLKEQAALPGERLSRADLAKIRALESSIQQQLARYGFITFPPRDLTVSDDTYRPEKEGFEIGFELSASDSVRLKWAYQLGLLDVSRKLKTNHPGLVVFDEPRQQEAAERSVEGLLAEAANIASNGTQIIIATSEDLNKVRSFIRGPAPQLIEFGGRLIDRIPPEDNGAAASIWD
jgi:hypothetical protein